MLSGKTFRSEFDVQRHVQLFNLELLTFLKWCTGKGTKEERWPRTLSILTDLVYKVKRLHLLETETISPCPLNVDKCNHIINMSFGSI